MPSSNRSGTCVRGRQQLVGTQRLEHLGPGGEHAAVGSEELVGRAGEEVGAERRHVDRCVRRVVHAVDVDQGAGGVGEVGDRAARRASCPAGWTPPVTATSRVRSLSTACDLRRRRARRSRGRSRPSARWRPPASAAITHGAHVGVVVEPGHDDLVARAPALGQGAGEVHGQLGHRPPEDDAAGVGRQQVGHRRPARRPRLPRRCARPASRRPGWPAAPASTSYIAWATTSGVCDPPGPSKWAAPSPSPARSWGKWERTRATSYAVSLTAPFGAGRASVERSEGRVSGLWRPPGGGRTTRKHR